jgi:hypothetical protein
MGTTHRRYEVLLPLKFNDGRPVPDELLGATLQELERQFGPISCESQPILGLWRHEGQTYRDKQVRVFVDVLDTDENRDFFAAFKERLKARFHQHDLWITTHPLEVV